MQQSPFDIRERLIRALDKDNNVVDMGAVSEIIRTLGELPITKDVLEKTRLAKYINEMRRKTANAVLAKSAKDLLRKWRDVVAATANTPGPPPIVNGHRINHRNDLLNSPVCGVPNRLNNCSSNWSSPGLNISPGSSVLSSSPSVSRTCTPFGAHVRRNGTAKPVSPLRKDNGSLSSPLISPASSKSPVCSKRLKMELEDSLDGKRSNPPSTISTPSLHNGIDYGDSNDSFRPPPEIVSSATLTNSNELDTKGRVKKQYKTRLKEQQPDVSLSLNDKFTNACKTSKVKTTAQLIDDLKARGAPLGKGVVTLTSPGGSVSVPSSSGVGPFRAGALPRVSDEDFSRSKNEFIEKFLSSSSPDRRSKDKKRKRKSPPEATVSVNPDNEHLDVAPPPVLVNRPDSPSSILATLPPIRPEDIDWSSDDYVIPAEQEERCFEERLEAVADEEVSRLHNGNWPNVNGTYNHDGEFRRWHETLSRTSYNGDMLHILPYVTID